MRALLASGAMAALCLAANGAASAQVSFHPYIEHGYAWAKQESASAAVSGKAVEDTGTIGQLFSVGLADIVGPIDLRVDFYGASIEKPSIEADENEYIRFDGTYVAALYTQPVGDRLELYAGGGVGHGEVFYNSCFFCFGSELVEGGGGGFSWELIAGARAKVWRSLGVFIEGRYMRGDDYLANEDADAADAPVTVDYPTYYRALVVTGGLRVQF